MRFRPAPPHGPVRSVRVAACVATLSTFWLAAGCDDADEDSTAAGADVATDSSGADAGADAPRADAATDALDAVDAVDAQRDEETDAPHADTTADGSGDATGAPIEVVPRPEPPRIVRDLARVDDAADFTSPLIPPNRTTMDGRIAINVQGGGPDLKFWLFVPERVEQPVLEGPAGRAILGDVEPWVVPFRPQPDFDMTGHAAICDPTGDFAYEGERPNPYACGPELANDCYDITVVSNTVGGGGARMWGVPFTIEVEQPKTPDARLVRVDMGEPVAGAFLRGSPEWTEPAVTIDGRLLTGRFGERALTWTNPRTGEARTERYDIMYSVLPAESDPCDVTGWTEFHPISYAHHDPAMRGRYGLAAYPLRDGEGNLVPEGADVGGTYPWVDRHGRNLFLSAVPDILARTPEEVYPRACASVDCPEYSEAEGWQKGYAVAGLWTHGRLVHIDAMINHTDWPLGVDPARHRLVELYGAGPGIDGPTAVRVGSGRVSRSDAAAPAGFGGNANIFDSIENLFQGHGVLRPGTPRDVVWLMSTGVATDEVVFDDWLDPDALIVASMQGSLTRGHPNSLFGMRYWNGLLDFLVVSDFSGEVHVQNAATATPDRWQVPAFGRVEGSARIEPVAMGGVAGKGLWLDGASALVFDIPSQPNDTRTRDLYAGLFVDLRRAPAPAGVALLTFPDGTGLAAVGDAGLRVDHGGGSLVVELARPWVDGWVHIAVERLASEGQVRVYVDGFRQAEVAIGEGAVPFDVQEGAVRVGPPAPGVEQGALGWIDELRVRLHRVDPEVACNHAHGTLVAVDAAHPLASVAGQYPGEAHEEARTLASSRLSDLPPLVACAQALASDGRALHHVPDGAVGLRDAIHFPEGPLRFGQPRPDSSRNAFCLSCHHVEGLHGLSVSALVPDASVAVENDRRRQPMAPPRRVFGNVPAGWVPAGAGPGGPDEAVVAPADGLLVEQFLLAR